MSEANESSCSGASSAPQSKLLFIDDDEDTRDVVSTLLTRRGFAIVCASTGADALAQLEADEFDAVISDLNMPNMSGLELCRRVHTQWPTLPVLLVTGFARKEMAAAAVRAGAYDVLSKPVQVDELLLTLARALSPKPLKQVNELLREVQ